MRALKPIARMGLAAWLALAGSGIGSADEAKVELREAPAIGQATRVTITLQADGSRPDYEARGKPLPFKVETHVDYLEKIVAIGPNAEPTQAVRRVERASAEIDFFRGVGQSMTVQIRPEVTLLISDRQSESVLTYSAGGPLLRNEVDLLQGPGDPLTLVGLLPTGDVGIGDSWNVGPLASKALTEYETLSHQGLKAKLEKLDDQEALIRLDGEIQGAVRGGEGTIKFDGELFFDRQNSLVRRLVLNREESRKKGHVESAIEAESTLTVTREPIELPEELSDEALKELSLEAEPHRLLLLYASPGGEYRILHDRNWHLAFEDVRRAVLKRIENGQTVAQCDLALGSRVGPGRHQDTDQFREDVRTALGEYFGEFVGSGEIDGPDDGNFRFKLAVEGKPREEAPESIPLWYYYLIASPEGDQLYAVFTLSQALEAAFGAQDLSMVGSLEWTQQAKDQ